MKQSAKCEVRSAKYEIIEKPSSAASRFVIQRSAPRASHTQGFTLLEVMVAVSIMAMVLVTLLGLKNRSMQDVISAGHITTATMLAKRLMVEATISRPRMPMEEEGVFPEKEFQDYTWKKTIFPLPIYAQIMEVHVAVYWQEGTRAEMVELVSYE